MVVVYLDVLVCINLFVSYFMLLATGKFFNIQMKRSRLILSSFLGGFYSLAIFLPEISPFFSIFLKLMLSTLIIFSAFGFKNMKFFLKNLAVFYLINFVFLGVMFLLYNFISPPGLFLKNNIIYLNISPVFLVISTMISYFCFNFLSKLSAKRISEKTFCNVCVEHSGKKARLRAKIDTGNTLREPFSSLPVMIAEYKFIENLIPNDIREFVFSKTCASYKSLRMIPFRAISGEGILPAFKPDKIFVENLEGSPVFKNAYIGVCKKGVLPVEFEALVSEELVN